MVWLPKSRLVGERLTTGEALPTPVTVTVWGLLAALLVKVREAASVPAARGVKVTVMVQLLVEATLVPQVFVWLKSVGFAPVKAMEVMLRVVRPVLVSVTVSGVDELPTLTVGKPRL